MAKVNGGIIGPANIPTGAFGSAPGVWKLAEAEKYIKEGRWPVVTTGFQVANSLRFDDGSSDTLSINMSTSANRRTFTFSTWVKKTKLTGSINLLGTGDVNDQNHLQYESSPLTFRHYNGTSNDIRVSTSRQFRDPSAWHHVVVAVDTTQATASDRVKFYINGIQETSFAEATYPSLNYDWDFFQNGSTTYIGRRGHSADAHFDGYLSEVVFIDGQQLDATSFGETDATTGNWIPKDVSGLTFGTSGFYLPFQNASALGQDDSGNGNNFTVNNLTSIDQCIDSPTNNFATLNPLYVPSASPPTFSNGNLTAASGSVSYFGGASTLGVSSGKWYWEVKCDSNNTTPRVDVGNIDDYTPLAFNSNNGAYLCYGANGYGYVANGNKCNNNSETSYGSTWTTNDIISVAMDLDNGYIYFAKNGTWQNSGDPESGASGTGAAYSMTTGLTYIAGCGDGSSTASDTFSFNFGNAPFTISSGNTDFSGLGNFEYSVPSGYRALCTKNIGLVG